MNETKTVIVVSPVSTGKAVAGRVKELGHRLVIVFPFAKPAGEGNMMTRSDVTGMASFYLEGSYEELEQAIRAEIEYPIDVVIAAAENGVLLADFLSEAFDTPRNPMELATARLNKYIMGETVRAAGVPAAKQMIATEWEEVDAFIRDWNPSPFKVIVKPNQSAGSDDIFCCKSLTEVENAFCTINGAINQNGNLNEGVLIQEFLEGVEYVVDSVSLNGEHKVVGLWKYDKRGANGQFNVYFGMSCCSVKSELELALVEYNSMVLDALKIFNGPSHCEIMMTKRGPILVEVGARPHGGMGSWKPIAQAAYGFNQIDATVDAVLRPEIFEQLPAYPATQAIYGIDVFLVSFREGLIDNMPGNDMTRKLPSFLAEDMIVSNGSKLFKTIDLFTMPGRVQLKHASEDQVNEDYEYIHGLLAHGEFFTLSKDTSLDAPEMPQE